MGNYRFKLSDMIPNAWFYKLKHFTKQPSKKKLHHHNNSSLVSNNNTVPLNSSPHHTTSPSSSSHYQRKSYYFTRDVNQPASSPIHGKHGHEHGSIYKEGDGIVLQPSRRSSKKRRSTRRTRASPRLVTSSIPAGYSCRSVPESIKTNNNHPDSTSQEYPNSAVDTSSETESIFQPIRVVSGSSGGGVTTTSTDNTMISSCTWSSRVEDDMKSRPPVKQFVEHVDCKRNHSVSNRELPSIKTKGIDIINKESEPTIIRMRSMKFGKRNGYGYGYGYGYGSLPESMKIVKNEEKSSPQVKRFSVSSNSPGVKLRTNSPRIVTRRMNGRKSISPRRSLSESFAVVKSSKDPEKDFRDSMVEMIVEHNIWSSKELEDLLTCYLSLNSYKYHDIIISVFKQIWFQFVHTE